VADPSIPDARVRRRFWWRGIEGERALEDRRRGVDVLDLLDPRLVNLPSQQPMFDGQPPGRDRVGGAAAAESAPGDHEYEHRQDSEENPAGEDMPGGECAQHARQGARRHSEEKPAGMQAEHGEPRWVAVEDDRFAVAEVQQARPAYRAIGKRL